MAAAIMVLFFRRFILLVFAKFGDVVMMVLNTPAGNQVGQISVAITTARCEMRADENWAVYAMVVFPYPAHLKKSQALLICC